jgi:hypothetical protein
MTQPTGQRIFQAVALAALVVICSAVSSCNTTGGPLPPDPTGSDTTRTVTKVDIRPDSALGYWYIGFDDSVAVADSASDRWDVRLPYVFCCGKTREIHVVLNSGTVGIGLTTGIVLNQRFETVKVVPAIALRTDSLEVNKRVFEPRVLRSNSNFGYDGSTHTIRPLPDKTLLIKTRKGTFVKFQITSLYQNNDQNPTSNTPIGFYAFRYAKANGTTFPD